MSHESLQERQENEFQVLQAVFMDDLRDVRDDDVWKTPRPPEVQITLIPQASMSGNKDFHVKVDLHVKCGYLYPEDVPEISLKNSKGLSNTNLTELTNELLEMAKKLKGEVMILELAQHVQKFLHLHNKPRFNSFYDEMMSNHKKQEEELIKEEQKKLEALKLKEERERRAIEEEIQRKQEALKEEARWRKDCAKQASSDENSSSSPTNFPSPFRSRERARSIETITATPSPVNRRRQTSVQFLESGDINSKLCQHSNTAIITFNNKAERTIQRGKCLAHSSCGRVSFVGMDTKSGELVLVTEWVLKLKQSKNVDENSKQIENYLKQLSSIEWELNSLMRLQSNKLVNYLGMKSVVDKNKIIIHVLQDFINGRNITINDGIIPLCSLRNYIIGVIDAVAYLHQNSVVHKDLKFSNIFMENSGLVKISDYCVHKRLLDLISSTNEEAPPESEFPLSIGRGGKKSDIYRLGFIFLSLASGSMITDLVPKIPSSLPSEFSDFLKKCLMKNEHERWSAEQLQDHVFLKPGILESINLKVNGETDVEAIGIRDDGEGREKEIPLLNATSVDGVARLQKEFEVLKWLGKGGFGDVLKVFHKLDKNIYAIKRIALNQHNKLLNKKLTREVQLLSRVNHENVVRYFAAWLETVSVDGNDGTSSETTISASDLSKSSNAKQASVNVSDDIEKFAPPKVEGSLEWSVSHERSQAQNVDDSSSSEDEDDDDYVFGQSFFIHSDSSDGVVFETDEKKRNSQISETSGKPSATEIKTDDGPKLILFMYIQMEFCEKSTLRNAIDGGLYKDQSRVWRLFREMLEGLAHIHQQGIIHRDLKPVNVFLDSNDHVKIGDFGLATTDIIAKNNVLDANATDLTINVSNISRSDPMDDGTQTGRVGTALYVAPELNSSVKTNYTQKVDIYSVGIIFFEMSYRPLPTAMERVKVLSNIRHPEIQLPNDFNEDIMPRQVHITRWLLTHEVDKRPTSQELLQSEYLPPPQMEERQLQEMLRHTINNPQSKSYKHMISTLFMQQIAPAADFTYDMDYYKGSFNSRMILAQKFVRNELSKIFCRHGALNVITPLLMPKNSFYESNDSCVHIIDHSGAVVLLPYELKTSFARYIVKNNIVNLKRYAISRVYRERKVFGCQPRELFECVFDIVTPFAGSLITDAEVLAIVSEVITEFPALQNRCYVIQINHTSLLKAILIHCGVSEEKLNDVYAIFGDPKVDKCTKFQIQTKLLNLDLSDQTITMLYNFIESEGSLLKISNICKPILKKRGLAASFAKQGIHDLELIIKHSEVLGVKPQIVVTPGLVYAVHQFSGMFFKVVCELKKKRKVCMDVIAAGGRYDSLISSIRLSPGFNSKKEITQSAVGVSFALEKVTSAILEDEEFKPPSAFDVLVCSVGQHPMLKEKASVTKDLWNAGIKAHMIYDSTLGLEEIQSMCRESEISHIVLLKDIEAGYARVRWLEKDRFIEKKLQVTEVSDHLQKSLGEPPESLNVVLSRSDSSKSCVSTEQFTTFSYKCSISFFSMEKMALNTRRRYEGQISANVASVLQYISPKVCVQIMAVDLNGQVLKTIASHIEMDENESVFNTSLSAIVEKHPRHRKYLQEIFDEIHELRFQKKCPLVMLYSLADGSYKLLF